MSKIVRKTFDNSYLFSQNAIEHQKILVDFIINSERIDKNSEAFRGVVEEVKRRQSSSILYTILMSNNVILGIGKGSGLPKPFKVFEAKDLKTDRSPKVFIDVTGLVEFKNGYFSCKKTAVLITYIFIALGYLLYSKSTLKVLSNSNITISGTECFASMFNYILDYLRIIGYAQNKEKITYLSALYYQYNMLGKDLDMYTKNIAAKIAGLSSNEVRAYDLYFNAEKDFFNIDSFIKMIAENFKLKGLTTEVFIHRWNYSFGDGSYYATELFTAFLALIISAYEDAYIVNQKQIERCCGNSEVKLCTSLLQLAVEEFDNRGYMEASELDSLVARDANTVALKEALSSRSKMPEDAKFNSTSFKSKSSAKSTMNNLVKFYRTSEQENKISAKAYSAYKIAISAMKKYAEKNEDSYEFGALESIVKLSSKYINDKDKSNMIGDMRNSSEYFAEKGKKSMDDKEKAKRYNKCAQEIRKCLGQI